MKQITKYQAYNGHEFTSVEECEKYEAVCRKADEIVSRLFPNPKSDGCNFENGHGFIQQDGDTVKQVRRELLELANQEFPHKWFTQSIEDESVDPSWAGRLIDEGNENIRKAWYRIFCTDKKFREWGQPFYALNPDKGDQIELKPATQLEQL